MSTFVCGIDLGQASDFTAISVVQPARVAVDKTEYRVRWLERIPLGTSYPEQVAHIKQLLERDELAGRTEVIADATGVGRPVIDMLWAAGIDAMPITITGGDASTADARHIPKVNLIACLQVMLQNKVLRFADVPERETLVRELSTFEVKVSAAGRESYNAREGKHDDLVLSLALACYYAERCARPIFM